MNSIASCGVKGIEGCFDIVDLLLGARYDRA
jgi:hypothetical protein